MLKQTIISYPNRYFTYVGSARGVLPHGHGRILFGQDGVDGYAEGEFVDGQLTCERGRRVYPDGSIYEGGFVDGCFHGHGELRTVAPTHRHYVGGFSDNKFEGEGRLEWSEVADGREILMEYTGSFRQNRQHGKGRVSRVDAGASVCVYEGAFVDGFREGSGMERLRNGFTYTGAFAVDRWHGDGLLQHADDPDAHVRYAGPFRRGMPVCAPSRMCASVGAWQRPVHAMWPPVEEEVGKAGGGKKPSSASSSHGGTAKRPSVTATRAGSALVGGDDAAAETGPLPTARANAITLAPGGAMPPIILQLLYTDAVTKEDVLKRREAEALEAARLALEQEEIRRKEEEDAATAAAIAKGKKGAQSTPADASKTKAVPGGKSDKKAGEPAPADAGPPPLTEIASDAEEWERPAANESGRLLCVRAVKLVTEVTAFASEHPGAEPPQLLVAGSEAYSKQLRDGADAEVLEPTCVCARVTEAGTIQLPPLHIQGSARPGQYALVIRDVSKPACEASGAPASDAAADVTEGVCACGGRCAGSCYFAYPDSDSLAPAHVLLDVVPSAAFA